MPTCEAQTYQGSDKKCGRSVDLMPYFWFRDSHRLLSKEFTVCFEHSQKILSKLLIKEDELSRVIKHLQDKVKKTRVEMNRGSNIAEERQKMADARAEGRPIPKFKKMDDLKHEIDILYKKIDFMYGQKNAERNKTCRHCGYLLNEPEFDKDQLSVNYSHSDWHSDKGFRREVILYHTACGREWLFNNMVVDDKVKNLVLPRSNRQNTLDDVLEENEVIKN